MILTVSPKAPRRQRRFDGGDGSDSGSSSAKWMHCTVLNAGDSTPIGPVSIYISTTSTMTTCGRFYDLFSLPKANPFFLFFSLLGDLHHLSLLIPELLLYIYLLTLITGKGVNRRFSFFLSFVVVWVTIGITDGFSVLV